MPKTVNAICKKIIKVKNSFKISGIYFSRWEFWVSVAAPDTLCFKGLKSILWSTKVVEFFVSWYSQSQEAMLFFLSFWLVEGHFWNRVWFTCNWVFLKLKMLQMLCLSVACPYQMISKAPSSELYLQTCLYTLLS